MGIWPWSPGDGPGMGGGSEPGGCPGLGLGDGGDWGGGLGFAPCPPTASIPGRTTAFFNKGSQNVSHVSLCGVARRR